MLLIQAFVTTRLLKGPMKKGRGTMAKNLAAFIEEDLECPPARIVWIPVERPDNHINQDLTFLISGHLKGDQIVRLNKRLPDEITRETRSPGSGVELIFA